VTMVLVGGIGSLWGSVFGAVLLTLLPEMLHAVKEFNVLMYGLILMIVLVLFPHGLLRGLAGVLSGRAATEPPERTDQAVLRGKT
jgi:branched-chain amino acid transport system permease protein